jgi:hypothetical protein
MSNLARARMFVAAAAVASAAGLAAAQPTERTIFVGHYFTQGSVASLRVGQDGTLTLLGNVSSGEWTQSIALSPGGRWLAAGAGTSSAVQETLHIFRVNADGSLSFAHLAFVPDSPLDLVWLSDDLLAVIDSGTSVSTVGIYRWNPDAPSLTETDRQTSGGFNGYLAYHPGSDYFYTQISSGTGGPSLTRWLINGVSGEIAAGGTFFTDAYPLAPRFSPRGDMLFAGGGISAGGRAMLAFLVSEEEGGLLPTPGSPFQSPGNSPNSSAVSGDGRILAMAHGSGGIVRTFLIAPDGSLTFTDRSFVVQPTTGAIGEIAVLGDVVYVTDDTSASDGVQGIHALRLGADGSLTSLAPLLYTGSPRAEGGIAVWDPTRLCPADFDGNSTVNSADISAYLTRWLADVTAGGAYADFDASGGTNSSDISAFLTRWLSATAGDCA